MWPKHKTLSEWATWSADSFLPTATPEKAKEWHAYYATWMQKLHASTEKSAEAKTAYDKVMDAYGKATNPQPADEPADDFGAPAEQKAAA